MKQIILRAHEVRRLQTAGEVLVVRPVNTAGREIERAATTLEWAQALAQNTCFGRRITDREIEERAASLAGRFHPFVCSDGELVGLHCPLGTPSERRWVRETFITGYEMDDNGYFTLDDAGEYIDKIWYRASTPNLAWFDGESDWPTDPKWRSPVVMPRWASRYVVEIAEVQARQVQAISTFDAEHTGVNPFVHTGMTGQETSCQAAFRTAWQKENGPDSWDANPWAWFVRARRVEA